METTDLITYPTEIFTDGSKIGDKVGTGVAIQGVPGGRCQTSGGCSLC